MWLSSRVLRRWDLVEAAADILTLCRSLVLQVIINYLVDQAEKKATTSRKKADQVRVE